MGQCHEDRRRKLLRPRRKANATVSPPPCAGITPDEFSIGHHPEDPQYAGLRRTVLQQTSPRRCGQPLLRDHLGLRGQYDPHQHRELFHRYPSDTEIRTVLRQTDYTRDLWAWRPAFSREPPPSPTTRAIRRARQPGWPRTDLDQPDRFHTRLATGPLVARIARRAGTPARKTPGAGRTTTLQRKSGQHHGRKSRRHAPLPDGCREPDPLRHQPLRRRYRGT